MFETGNLKIEHSEGLNSGDGLNWYIYANNNPLRFVDPTGLYILETRKSYNDFHMGSADKIWSGNENNLGSSKTSVSKAGCFATAYAREANAWQAYSLENKGVEIGEDTKPWLDNFAAMFLPSKNFSTTPGKEDLILRTTREETFKNIMGSDPVVETFQETEDMTEAITSALSSDNPYTIVGVVEGASGGVHAINIDGYDTETGIANVYDTYEGNTTRYEVPISSFKEVRTMTAPEATE